jgi:type VI secretion system protein ImpL
MLKILTNPWLVRVPGFIAFALLVHVVGPLIAFGNVRPLESAAARWGLIVLVAAVWLARHLWKVHKAKRAQGQMVEALMKAPTPAEPDASAEELKTLKGRFEEALAVLRKSRGGKLNLYELPW